MKWNKEIVESNLANLQHPSVGEDIGFSWYSCWACERPLGGNRHELNYIADGEVYHEEICTDCAMYIANGEEPEER